MASRLTGDQLLAFMERIVRIAEEEAMTRQQDSHTSEVETTLNPPEGLMGRSVDVVEPVSTTEVKPSQNVSKETEDKACSVRKDVFPKQQNSETQ